MGTMAHHAAGQESGGESGIRTPFNPSQSPLTSRMATGHEMRTGHTLTGYYVTTGGISTLIRTCGC